MVHWHTLILFFLLIIHYHVKRSRSINTNCALLRLRKKTDLDQLFLLQTSFSSAARGLESFSYDIRCGIQGGAYRKRLGPLRSMHIRPVWLWPFLRLQHGIVEHGNLINYTHTRPQFFFDNRFGQPYFATPYSAKNLPKWMTNLPKGEGRNFVFVLFFFSIFWLKNASGITIYPRRKNFN